MYIVLGQQIHLPKRIAKHSREGKCVRSNFNVLGLEVHHAASMPASQTSKIVRPSVSASKISLKYRTEHRRSSMKIRAAKLDCGRTFWEWLLRKDDWTSKIGFGILVSNVTSWNTRLEKIFRAEQLEDNRIEKRHWIVHYSSQWYLVINNR